MGAYRFHSKLNTPVTYESSRFSCKLLPAGQLGGPDFSLGGQNTNGWIIATGGKKNL
jgi:hypothetical protein